MANSGRQNEPAVRAYTTLHRCRVGASRYGNVTLRQDAVVIARVYVFKPAAFVVAAFCKRLEGFAPVRDHDMVGAA